MSEHNYFLKKQNKDERLLSLNQNDIHAIFEWLNHFEKINNYKQVEFDETENILANGPITEYRDGIWVKSRNLKHILTWFKYYPNPNDYDKEIAKIVEDTLNPPEPSKLKK